MNGHGKNRGHWGMIISAAAVSWLPCVARGQYVPIYGGLTYDAAGGNGYSAQSFAGPGILVNDNGTAVGSAVKNVSGVNRGQRAVRWDAAGNAQELPALGTSASGSATSDAFSINIAGQVAGQATKYVNGVASGTRAVRWDAAGNVLELDLLGISPVGVTESFSVAINTAGQIAGHANSPSGTQGYRAVRWEFNGSVQELGNLGTDSSGFTSTYARAINDAGQTAGTANKYVSGISKGTRAVLWDSSGAAHELAALGTDPSGVTSASAGQINNAGQTGGSSEKYVNGTDMGQRATRWDANGNVLELGNLGADASGNSSSLVSSINASGQTAGYAEKFLNGSDKGRRGVRWDVNGSALELANLGTDASGSSTSQAYSINVAGQIAGHALKYVGGVSQGRRAVYWNSDGSVVDLNTLISPSSNWTLTLAAAISDSGWVTGFGDYDPDGPGGAASYQRDFLLDISPTMNWINTSGGAWGSGSNWSGNFVPGPGADAVFNLNSGASYTVNVSTSQTIHNLIVRTDKPTLNIAAGLTLTATASVQVGASGGNGQLTITGGGALSVPAVQLQNNSVMILAAGSGRTLKVSSLSISGAARLDLEDNKLIIDYTSPATSPLATIQAQITSAYAGGSWNGAGITSSVAPGGFGGHATSLGYAEASAAGYDGGSFGGQSIDSDAVLVRYTLSGDSNLDGSVDLTDFTYLAANFNGTSKNWLQGDYNYDGKVDLTDFTFLASNFNSTLPASELTGAPVPEPPLATMLAPLMLAGRRWKAPARLVQSRPRWTRSRR